MSTKPIGITNDNKLPARALGAIAASQELRDTMATVVEAAKRNASDRLFGSLSTSRTKPVRLAFAGSSTTEGAGAATAANRWVNRFVAMVQSAYPSATGTEIDVVASSSANWGTVSTAAGVQGYNAGQGSTASDNYLIASEITSIDALNPAAVFHMVGSNDFDLGYTPQFFRTHVQNVIDQFKAKNNPTPCVHVLIQSYERFEDPTHAYPWSAYGQVLREIAAADPANVIFIDLQPAFEAIGIPTADPLDVIGPDSIHPTDAGHALLADLTRRALGIAVSRVSAAPAAGGSRGITADSYSRADGNLPGSITEAGAKTWVAKVTGTGGNVTASDILVVGGAVGAKSGGLGSSCVAFVDTGYADMTVEGKLAALGSGPGARGGGLAVRAAADGSLIWLSTRVTAAVDGYALYSVAGGTTTELARNTAVVPAVGDALRVVCSGTTVTAYVNGVQVLQVTTSSVQTNTGAGWMVHSQGAASRYDEFRVTT